MSLTMQQVFNRNLLAVSSYPRTPNITITLDILHFLGYDSLKKNDPLMYDSVH